MRKFFFLGASLLVSASAFALQDNFVTRADSFKDEVIADWKSQCADFKKGCKEQIARIERLLADESLKVKGFNTFSKKFDELKKLEDGETKYIELRKLKRAIMFASAELDFDEIILVDAPYPDGHEAPHESRFKTENTAVYGANLLRLNPASGESIQLAPSKGKEAAIWRASLDFDAKKIVFQMRQGDDTNYHLYTVDADGKNLKKLTNAKYNDVDPTWLPDGNIVFCTSRGNGYVRCAGSAFPSTVLARCDADGKNIYFLSTNNEADFMPYILEDGRIIYCRWEYVDKNIFRIQSLWTVNPDGTNPQVFWGGQSHYPDLKIGAIQIPDTDKYIFQTSSHHNVFRNGVAVLRPTEGINYPDGIYNLTPTVGWAESGFGPWDKSYNKDFYVPENLKSYYSPFPIGQKFYLVSGCEGQMQHYKIGHNIKFKLYLADYDGNLELLHVGKNNIVHAQPVKARKRPRIMPSSIEFPTEKVAGQKRPTGTLYSGNIYEGSGIPFGMAKKLRVIEHCAATYQDGVRNSGKEEKVIRDYLKIDYGSLGVFDEQSKDVKARSQFFLSGETTMSILLDESHKRILGEVDIEDDGSVSVEIPAMKAVYFQLLDKDGKVLQTMRSSTHVMGGESRGCVGCHATRMATTPQTRASKALRKAPQKLVKPFGDITFGFQRYIQPILDKYCISCHSEAKGHKLVLEGKKIAGNTPFTVSYINLVCGIDRKPSKTMMLPNSIAGAISPYSVYKSLDTDTPVSESTIAPMQVLSYTSPLIVRLQKGHSDVKLSKTEMAKLMAWIDLNCPFYGEEDVLDMPDIDEESFYKVKAFKGLSQISRMRTSPDVDRVYRQDKYNSQDDRLAKDKDGKIIPSIRYEGDKRIVTE